MGKQREGRRKFPVEDKVIGTERIQIDMVLGSRREMAGLSRSALRDQCAKAGGQKLRAFISVGFIFFAFCFEVRAKLFI